MIQRVQSIGNNFVYLYDNSTKTSQNAQEVVKISDQLIHCRCVYMSIKYRTVQNGLF